MATKIRATSTALFLALALPLSAQSQAPDQAASSESPRELCVVQERVWPLVETTVRSVCLHPSQIIRVPDATEENQYEPLRLGVEDWVKKNPTREVNRLLIYAHGSAGNFDLGSVSSNIDDLSARFQALSAHMTAGAKIDIGSCLVGKSCRGRVFMAGLARVLLEKGGTVTATTNFFSPSKAVRPVDRVRLFFHPEQGALLWIEGGHPGETLEQVCQSEFLPAYRTYSELMKNPAYRELASNGMVFTKENEELLNWYLRRGPFTMEILDDPALTTLVKLERLDQLYHTEVESPFGGGMALWLNEATEKLRMAAKKKADDYGRQTNLLMVPLL